MVDGLHLPSREILSNKAASLEPTRPSSISSDSILGDCQVIGRRVCVILRLLFQEAGTPAIGIRIPNSTYDPRTSLPLFDARMKQ